MNETMTPEQFVEIVARHHNATPGPWYYDPTYGEMFLSSSYDGHLHGIGDLAGFGDGDQADADREFVIHSHGDVGALLAEVYRLRTELAETR